MATATKHLRPGVPEGMPLEDAEAKAKSLDTVIRASITRNKVDSHSAATGSGLLSINGLELF